MTYTGDDVSEWRRVYALEKAIEVYRVNSATGILVLAKEFEKYLKGEGDG